MNSKQRQDIADRLTLMAERTGAAVSADALAAEIIWKAHWPDVSVTAFIDNGPCLLHWHNAKRALNDAVFSDVNPYHHKKATTYAANWNGVCKEFARLSTLVANGDAFAS